MINDPAVKSTQHLVPSALADAEGRCWWTRGIVPRSRYPDVPQVPEELETFWMGDPDEWQHATKVYLDGSGGERTSDPRLRRCGWGAVIISDDPILPPV